MEHGCHEPAPLSRAVQLCLYWFSQLLDLCGVLRNRAVAIPGDVGD